VWFCGLYPARIISQKITGLFFAIIFIIFLDSGGLMPYIYTDFTKTMIMKKSEVIEKFGGLVKIEPVTCLEDMTLMKNACLLEATEPFYGYYNDVPDGKKPLYLFIVLDGLYSVENVVRATINVKKKVDFSFDAAFGNVQLFDHTCPVIRIRDLADFHNIKKLQKLYHAEGLKFRKKLKSFSNEKAIITLHKLFYLRDLGEGTYLDGSQPHHGYFTVPKYIELDAFVKLTKEVKFDTSLLFFDAAYAWYYQGERIVYMVRIYRENLTAEKLEAIRDRYLSLIK
jgi:hypothetical protein